jgi:hypothetical protein
MPTRKTKTEQVRGVSPHGFTPDDGQDFWDDIPECDTLMRWSRIPVRIRADMKKQLDEEMTAWGKAVEKALGLDKGPPDEVEGTGRTGQPRDRTHTAADRPRVGVTEHGVKRKVKRSNGEVIGTLDTETCEITTQDRALQAVWDQYERDGVAVTVGTPGKDGSCRIGSEIITLKPAVLNVFLHDMAGRFGYWVELVD